MKYYIAFILILIISFPAKSQEEKRIALVIGNARYKYGNSLKNPVNDAELMSRTLKGLNFQVIKKINANRKQMNEAIVAFSKKLKDFDVALFYYAGHGIQVEGVNYVIPVDAKINDPIAVGFEALKVDHIVSQFEYYPNHANIVILDACRENPFLSWVRGGMNSFSPVKAPKGTFIAFATGNGSVAFDGVSSANGLYSGILAKQMKVSQRIEDVFINTRNEVYKASKGQQQPQEWSQLSQAFYFTGSKPQDNSMENTNKDLSINSSNIAGNKDSARKVNTDLSIQESDFRSEVSGQFTDIEDGIKYKWVKIGKQIWMAENTKRFVDEDNSFCVHYLSKNCDTLGMLYTWEGATEACPIGWHLPSIDDWKELLDFVGNDKGAAHKLKSINGSSSSLLYWPPIDGVVPVNSSGFSAVPAGILDTPYGFSGRNKYASFWTSNSYGKDQAYHYLILSESNKLKSNVWPKEKGFSVRCIKNK